MNRLINSLLMLGFLALQTGCASAPTAAEVPDIPAGTTLQLSVVIPEWQSPNSLTDTEGAMLLGAGGAAAGALSGAAVGVGASLTCGPAMLFCASFTVPAGLLTGGLIGLGVGTTEGLSKGIAKDDANALEAATKAALLKHTQPASLASTFAEHASTFWTTTREDTDVAVTLAVAPLKIKQENRGLIRFETTVSALVDYGDGRKPKTYTFPRSTALRSVKTLVDDDGAQTDQIVEQMYQHGIRQVIVALSDSLGAPNQVPAPPTAATAPAN